MIGRHFIGGCYTLHDADTGFGSTEFHNENAHGLYF